MEKNADVHVVIEKSHDEMEISTLDMYQKNLTADKQYSATPVMDGKAVRVRDSASVVSVKSQGSIILD